MRLWRISAVLVAILGLTALALGILAEQFGVRLGGFDAFFTPSFENVGRISILFVVAALFLLADRISAMASEVGRLLGQAVRTDRVVEDPGSLKARETSESVYSQDVPPEDPKAASLRTQSSGSVIRISHVSKRYRLGPVEVHALRDVDLDIPPGSLTVILGPSGSGKTTLLNLLGGIDRATSGRIRVDGTDVTKLDEAHLVDYRREQVGFVFQFFNLIPSLTARENVGLAAELVPHPADVERVLRAVGLGERMDHFPAELSGGEQQRVAIARALVKNPPLLLCDEPTGELDYATGIKILEILKDVAHGDGRAVIVVTHNAAIAEMADLVVRLRGGRIDQVSRNPEPVPPQMLRW